MKKRELIKMLIKLRLLPLAVAIFSTTILGQVDKARGGEMERLPVPVAPIECELVLRFLDDALDRAFKSDSNVIIIIKTKHPESTLLVRNRTANLRKYLKLRKFEHFEVAVDLDPGVRDEVHIHVRGERLYALPIAAKDKLDLSVCVVGPKS
jgi:hypothetical protein